MSARTTRAENPLLEVDDLSVSFSTGNGAVRVLDGVTFSLTAGRTLGIIGESGSGKSVTARVVAGLLRCPPGNVEGGRVLLSGVDLLRLPPEQRRELSGTRIGLIFQEPMSALNPMLSIGYQVGEVLRRRAGYTRKAARQKTLELMVSVGLPEPESRIGDYPHQFSGGMLQRILIAMAVALNPSILIADEPTTALDVTIQAQILELLATMQRTTGMGLIFITHDLGVASQIADEILVMYAGRVMETGPTEDILARPSHPYTKGLLRSLPTLENRSNRLDPIRGTPPDPARMPPGCPYNPRCDFAEERCRSDAPPLRVFEGRSVACHFAEQVAGG